MTKISRSDILTKEFLEECFVADFATGTLTWKVRPLHHFPSVKSWKIWNTSYSGTVAGATSWRTKSYFFRRVTICKMYFPIHHVVWVMYTGSMFDSDSLVLDHIDRDPLNNAISNLRLVSHQENTWNMSGTKRVTSLSEFKGVCYDSGRQKWLLQIRTKSGKIRGRFNDEQSAAYLYRVFSEEFHKEYSPSFLQDVEFPEVFDFQSITPSIRKALEAISEGVQKKHDVLFKGLTGFKWKRIVRGTNTGVEGVTLVTPNADSTVDKRKFISICKVKGRKSYSVCKYGYEEAFKLACEWASGS